MSTLLFSIVIPTCNRTGDLLRCLEIVVPQVEAAGRGEILVCDDGGTDETRQALATRFPSVQWQQGPRRGPAANRNLGAARAQGEWLIFLDDDCVPSPTYLQAYLEGMRGTPPHTALEGATWRIGEISSPLWEAPHNSTGGTLISCNFAIAKSFFEKIGRFDERYPTAAFEDTEFALRFETLGGQIQFLAEARVDHPLRRVPSAPKLANRWEPRVIYALDLGAGPFTILWRLPWHVFRLILHRLQPFQWNADHFQALGRFALEWFYVVLRTPGWIKKRRAEPRSPFWREEVRKHGSPPRFGF